MLIYILVVSFGDRGREGKRQRGREEGCMLVGELVSWCVGVCGWVGVWAGKRPNESARQESS